MLAERTIRAARASDKDQFLSDGGGLYLRVSKAGAKTFVHKDQRGGKTKWETLGKYPEMSVADARAALARRKSTRVSETVASAFDRYYTHLQTQFVEPGQVKRMFDKDVVPHVGDKMLVALSRSDFVALMNHVVARGSPVMANRLLTQLRRFLAYCRDQGWVDTNVLEGVSRRNVGGKERAKDRHLSFPEIETLLQFLSDEAHRLSAGTRWALYGCLLTGLRATEVLTLTDAGETHTKMQRAHRVPMTRLVQFWLSRRPTPLPRDHRVLSQALRDHNRDFTPHDLRRTFASRLADLGVAPHVIEKLLDHRLVGVMAVYNRADYWPERYAAQRLWDRTLCRLWRSARKSRVSPAC